MTHPANGMHWNDNVLEILQFSYENDNANAKYREPRATVAGTPTFADAIYTETLLDERLLPDILDDKYDLILITGNPGDGKTAFLDRLYRAGRTAGNRPVNIRHDATQPDRDDREVLAEVDLDLMLGDLTDERWDPDKREVRVIGINEGMLARTILKPGGKYGKLSDLVRKKPKVGEKDFRCVTINLNDRALVRLPLDGADGLLVRLINRLTSEGIWERGENGSGCDGCPAEPVCPLLANARLLRLPRPQRQMGLLFGIAQFQRHRHVSLRDALAALAYLIVGHEDMYRAGNRGTGKPEHPCAYVLRIRGEERWGHLYRRLFYHAAFDDGDVFEGYFDALGEDPEGDNRLYGQANAFVTEQLNAADPVDASNEALDAVEVQVVANPVGTIAARPGWMSALSGLEDLYFERLSRRFGDIDEVVLSGQDSFEDLRETSLRLSYVVSRAAKRRAFFFDPALADGDVTPYRSLPEFFGVLSYLADRVERRLASDDAEAAFDRAVDTTIPGGIIASERLPVPPSPIGRIDVRLGEGRGSIGASMSFPITDATDTLFPPNGPSQKTDINEHHKYHPSHGTLRYVEYFPTFLIYRPFPDHPQHLILTLDLYELLYRLSGGVPPH